MHRFVPSPAGTRRDCMTGAGLHGNMHVTICNMRAREARGGEASRARRPELPGGVPAQPGYPALTARSTSTARDATSSEDPARNAAGPSSPAGAGPSCEVSTTGSQAAA
jgi:hypothetical protein